MNKTFREQAELPGVGQRCYYWRIQGLPTLQKNKWLGPARVVAHETNDEKKVVVVWVAHGTNLLRCAPHQVRPVVEETGYATVADPAAAMEALRDLRARSTTQFRDVLEPEPATQDVLDEARDDDDVSMDYEPSEHVPEHDSDADDEGGPQPVLPPQSQAAFLYQHTTRPHRPLQLLSRSVFDPPLRPPVAPPLLPCPPPLLFSLLESSLQARSEA